MKTLSAVAIVLFFFACSDKKGATSEQKDIIIDNTRLHKDRAFVSLVNYAAPKFHPETDEWTWVGEDGTDTIRDYLKLEVAAVENCWQLVRVEKSFLLEVFPKPCLKQGWYQDQLERSFFLVVDGDLNADNLKDEKFALRRQGKVVGELRRKDKSYFLHDLYCSDLEAACDVKIKHRRFRELSVNVKHKSTDHPQRNKRFGWSVDGKRLLCPDLESDVITTEGSFFADACRYFGFDYLVCANAPSATKYLCEADIGKVSAGLSEENHKRIMALATPIIPKPAALTKVDSFLYDTSAEDPYVFQSSMTLWVKLPDNLSDDENLALLKKVAEAIKDTKVFSDETVTNSDGRSYKLEDFRRRHGIWRDPNDF